MPREHIAKAATETHAREHDLRQQDIVRKDRQNFEVVVRACSPRTRAAIAAWGAKEDQDAKGTAPPSRASRCQARAA